MAKRIKNNSGSDKTWVGQLILNGNYYNIQPGELEIWANDETLLTDISNGNAIVANDDEDITDVAHALVFLNGTQRTGISLITNNEGSIVNLTNYKVIAVHPWNKNRSYSFKNGVLFLEVQRVSALETLVVRMIDTTNAQVLGSVNITTSGFYEVSIAKPTSNAGLELQAKTSNALSSSTIKGARLEFDSE